MSAGLLWTGSEDTGLHALPRSGRLRSVRLAIDVTLRSALTSCGGAIPGAPGKERKYTVLLEGVEESLVHP